MRQFFKTKLNNWKISEIIWLFSSVLIIVSLSIYWEDSLIGIIAAVSGVSYVILTGKGRPSGYIFGVINVLLYAYISMGAKYYGEVMLNILYYLPMNFVGWFVWRKNMDDTTGEVRKKRLSQKSALFIFGATLVAIFVYGELLKRLGGNMAYMDSMSTVISVVAQILCVKRYIEQWILWIVVDIVTVVMWIFAFVNGGDSVATLIMWSLYLVNGFIIYFKWNKDLSRQAVSVEFEAVPVSDGKLSYYDGGNIK